MSAAIGGTGEIALIRFQKATGGSPAFIVENIPIDSR